MYNYNTTRKSLVLKAYGRNVQQLVEDLRALENRIERTQRAKGILQLMKILDVTTKHGIENIQKRWDALFMLADYSLEVDSPYPIPEKVVLKQKAQHTYTQQPVKLRSYGRNVERLIQKATATKDPETQEQMIIGIVKLMKNLSNVCNGDNVNCDTLLTYIKQLGKRQFVVDLDKLQVQHICSSTHRDKYRGNKTGRGTGRRRQSPSVTGA